MRHLASLCLVALLSVIPVAANAGAIVEVSVGSGAQVKPDPKGRIPTNIMVAPGYGLGTLLRAELGVAGALGDVENSKFDLELRPMLVLSPPMFPMYARAIFAVTNLLNDRQIAYGGAIGFDAELMDTVGAFGEVGVLPRKVESTMTWIVEGRAGIYLAF